MKYKVGDLVGIGWNGKLKRPCPAIVMRVIEHTFGGFVYVVRSLDEEARESWCDAEALEEWKTDKI